jgi:O-antigen ligase
MIKKKLINLLFLLIPFSYIAGNLFINLNIFLIAILGLIFYGKDLLKINFIFIDKLILFLFGFFLLNASYNHIADNYLGSENINYIIIKTALYFRYLFFYIVTRYLVEKKLINFKFFLISCLASCLFVSLDITFQLIFGKDIFGYEAVTRKLSGPFGDEWIAGGFLQRFAPLGLYAIPFFFKDSNAKNLIFFSTVTFLLVLLAIILSGNRMPLVLFLFVIFLLFIFENKLRKYLLKIALISAISIFSVYNLSFEYKTQFDGFITHGKKISKAFITKEVDMMTRATTHYAEFESFYDTWLMNKYTGGGIRSFRINCPYRENIELEERSTCNTHPHNYYLEILTDSGLVGLTIIVLIFSLIFYTSFIKKYFTNSNLLLKSNYILTPFIFLFIAEIFPIKSTGSFFTTHNSAYIFFLMAVIVGFSKQKG